MNHLGTHEFPHVHARLASALSGVLQFRRFAEESGGNSRSSLFSLLAAVEHTVLRSTKLFTD